MWFHRTAFLTWALWVSAMEAEGLLPEGSSDAVKALAPLVP